ncbi:MAG: insulinase family protein [Proteobacteria bacterium]|nr:insulinase family protein [Pseudomonadota bacterium]
MTPCRFIAILLGVVFSVLPLAAANAVEIRQVTTPLGIKAWLVQDKSVPVVTMSFAFDGGTASEPESQKGVTSLMAILLTDGAGALPARAFKQRSEDNEVWMGFGASVDRLSGTLRVLSANRDVGFEQLRSALMEPRFDDDMIEQRRAQALSSLAQSEQRPGTVATRIMMKTMFAGHPYAAETSGLRDSLKVLTAADIKARAKALLSRTGLIVAAVGDIDEAEFARQLDRAFGGLPEGPVQPDLPAWVPAPQGRTIAVERPVPQSTVQIAFPGIARDDPDWYAAFVMNHILGGGGLTSRLATEVREKRGLAYGASSGLRNYRKASLLVISTATANEKVVDTLRVMRAEVARLRADGVTDQELADAKTYLAGALPVSLDSSTTIAALLYSMQVDHLPRDYLDKRARIIGAVTAADVRRVARRLLRDDAALTVVVGKPVGLPAEP